MMLYISTLTRKYLAVFKWTQNSHSQILKGTNSKNVQTRVTVLVSACHLIILYMSMKFHENILNGFQVIEGTQNYHCRISKGNNSNMY